MDHVMAFLGSIVMPLVLVTIGYRGIPKAQRGGAAKVIAGIVFVVLVGTCIFVTVQIVMTPTWVREGCETAYAEISHGPQAAEPSLAREPFMASCQQLSNSATSCVAPSFFARFPDHCATYYESIHTRLPALSLSR